MSNEPVAKYEPIELHVLHSHIAGVLFDFMGWLTSRKERLTLSSADHAGPAVEAITEFAKMRGLHLEDAQVEHWQAILTHPVDDTALLRQALEALENSRAVGNDDDIQGLEIAHRAAIIELRWQLEGEL